jgi:hypothetical protein
MKASRSSRQWRTAGDMKVTVFCAVESCSLVEIYRRFRGGCCLHHQDNKALSLSSFYGIHVHKRLPSDCSEPTEPVYILSHSSSLNCFHIIFRLCRCLPSLLFLDFPSERLYRPMHFSYAVPAPLLCRHVLVDFSILITNYETSHYVFREYFR